MKIEEKIYENVVKEFIEDIEASILICGGGIVDRNVFSSLGFKNVLITGLEEKEYDYSPYSWKRENAEYLSFPDNSFDFVVMHSAIHHTQLPHKVVTEMYRVSKKGLLAFEGRDSFLIRIAERSGLTQEYEVASNSIGVNATEIPNYIYRWTEREVEKTIKTYAPEYKHRFIYRYSSVYPSGPDLSSFKKVVLKLIYPLFWIFTKLFHRQQNKFVFFVAKPVNNREILPWLFFDKKSNKICVNKEWIKEKYRFSRNRRA